MKNKVLQKILAVSLSMTMILSMAACGSTGDEDKKEESKSSQEEGKKEEASSDEEGFEEVTELTYYSAAASTSTGTSELEWLDTYLRDNVGVTLKVRANGDGVLESMIASGELTDINLIMDETMRNEAIEAGLILDVSQYKDQLPNLFENDTYAKALAYEMDKNGGVYGLPLGVGDQSGFGAVPDIRWDVYGSVGYPEVETIDELLDVLKEMQDAYPETEAGEDVYAFGLFSEWDYGVICQTNENYMWWQGYQNFYNIGAVPADYSSEPEYFLADDSIYYDALKFFFKANQMGMLDPDSPTMTFDEYCARGNAGRYLMTTWSWYRAYNKPEEGIGYMHFVPEAFTLIKKADAAFGHAWKFCIDADTENLDAVLRFLNWVYSFEGQEMLQNGEPGLLYEYDSEGNRVLTESYAAALAEGKNRDSMAEEGHFNTYNHVGELNNLVKGSTVMPGMNHPVGLGSQYPKLGTNKIDQDWYSVYGEKSIDQLAEEKLAEGKAVQASNAGDFLPTMPSDINDIQASFASYMNEISWKMVYAADEAEFDALWDQMQKEAEAADMDKVYEFAKEAYAEAVKTLEKYTK